MSKILPIDLLKRVPLFANIDNDFLIHLCIGLQKKSFKRGEVILKEGQEPSHLFVVLSGHAYTQKTIEETTLITSQLNPGDIAAQVAVLSNTLMTHCVVASEKLDALLIDKKQFSQVCTKSIVVLTRINKIMIEQLSDQEKMLSRCNYKSASSKLAHTLLCLDSSASLYPDQTPSKDEFLIDKKLSKTELAQMSGCTRETASRQMSSFLEQGFVEIMPSGQIKASASKLKKLIK